MIFKAQKGQVSAGEAVGILLLDTCVPFIPGDVANATTYAYPVRFKKVEGFTVARAIGKDPSVYDDLERAAKDLVSQGVKAVTGDCGFMGIHQQRLAHDLGVPVFLSSLTQIPFITHIIGPLKKVGVISASGQSLDASLLAAVGITDTSRVVIAGLENRKHFHSFAIEETGYLDSDAVEKEVVETAVDLVGNNKGIGALLLECSLLPPYAKAIQEVTELPVFDYITMIDYVYSALVKRRYGGYL